MRSGLLAACAAAFAIFVLTPPPPIQAATIQWAVNNGNFNDGGVVSGSLIWDTTLQDVVSWNFTVSGGNTAIFPSTTYTTGTHFNLDGGLGNFVLIFNTPVNRQLRFAFADGSLDTPTSNVALVASGFTNATGYLECTTCGLVRAGLEGATFSAVDPSAVPLPTALPLFATGLGVLGLLGWRTKRKSANQPSK